jgi:predicted DNA-binding transcriptional regulator YafY
MRADRLVAALLILQAKGRVTAAELAEQLEISERTARRDLEALAVAGIPVYSQQGRGGGWSLLGGSRTDLTGLTRAEARALFLVAGPSSASPELRAALRKLVRALPESFRAEAEAAAGAVVVDPAGWGRRGEPRPMPEHLDALQRVVVEGRQARLAYVGRDGRASERTVHPLGLVTKGDVWYLVAQTEAGQRTFRVDRVQGLVPLAEAAVRPPGFDLGKAWEEIAEVVDEFRATLVVEAVVERGALRPLRALFGPRGTVGTTDPDGRTHVRLTGSNPWMLAHDLAGFGGAVEVRSPDEVRRLLGRLGRELVERYGADGEAGTDAGAGAGTATNESRSLSVSGRA